MARVHDSIFDNFSEEALEALDFARCQRADGSFYGTSGQCRKGKEAGDKPAEQTRAKATKSGGVSNEQAMKLRASLTKQIGDAAKSGDLGKTNNLMQALAAVEGQLKARGVNLSGGGAMADAKADRMSVLKERIAAAKASGDKKKLKDLRNELQGLQRNAKVEAEARRTGRTFDDVARERAARADAKIKARIAARYPRMFANKPGAAKGGAMADAKAGEREVARGEKFIGRARAAMKRLSNERNVAQMRLQIGRVNQIDEAMKRLRKKAEQVGGRLDELTGTKGQGKYYVS